MLGTKLLGWTHCGYVEYNDYCQRVIRARIDDGILDDAPIFGDIRTFISDGYADSYQGMVDVVTGGFPCQPFSVAGKQQGADDSRNMWPETLAVLRIIRPRFAFLENVPGLLAHPYARRIFGDLAESGYDCRWRVLSAVECRNTEHRTPLRGVFMFVRMDVHEHVRTLFAIVRMFVGTWIEWLMGWPLGWADLKPLAMDKYQSWLQQHGIY